MARWQIARSDKECKYLELVHSGRCRLVVLALETGGRFSDETADFLRQLANAKAQAAPRYLRRSTAVAYERRWSRMLAVSAASAHVRSLVLDKDSLSNSAAPAHGAPWLQSLLTEARDVPATPF